MARYSKILGPDGQPIDKSLFDRKTVAGPTLAGVRSPISGHPADGLTPARLAAIHRAAATGDPLAYLELAEDIEERDLHYLAVLGTRRRQVAQLPISVEAASDSPEHEKHADHVRSWLREKVLAGALFDMLDAIGKGYSILEIEWESKPGSVMPAAMHWRDQRWFTFDDLTLDEPQLLDAAGKLPLEPHRFVVHRHKAKSGLTIRAGLARVASWAWMYKAFTQRDWAIFVQNYGMPIRIGRYHSAATDAELDILWRAVSGIAGDCAAIVPENMRVEFIEQKNIADGSELYEKRADWMDRQVSKLVLGQTATTDAIAGGHAVGKEHRLVQEDLERFDAGLVSTTVTRQIAAPMVAFTFGPQEKYPTVTIGRPDELPIPVIVDAISKLGPLGLEVEESQILDRLGFEVRAESVDGKPARVIGGRSAAPAPAPEPALQHRAASPSGGMLDRLFDLHARKPEPDHLEILTRRLGEDAVGALAGLTEAVRAEVESAEDMQDLLARLDRLELEPEAFQEAMARGMALAHMVGMASIIDATRDD